MSQTVMIAGCGDVGGRLGEALLADGWRVHGLRRSVDALPQGILPVAGDLQAPECPAQWPSEPLDYLRESEINQEGKARKLWDIEEGKGI